MDLRLQFLESFVARGSDGKAYKVCAYDRLARASVVDGLEHWEPTGQAEYRLAADGRVVAVGRDGVLRIDGLGVLLDVTSGSSPRISPP
jgi:hypothetical protein